MPPRGRDLLVGKRGILSGDMMFETGTNEVPLRDTVTPWAS